MKIKVRQANKQGCRCRSKREVELAKKEQEEREFRQKVRTGEKWIL